MTYEEYKANFITKEDVDKFRNLVLADVEKDDKIHDFTEEDRNWKWFDRIQYNSDNHPFRNAFAGCPEPISIAMLSAAFGYLSGKDREEAFNTYRHFFSLTDIEFYGGLQQEVSSKLMPMIKKTQEGVLDLIRSTGIPLDVFKYHVENDKECSELWNKHQRRYHFENRLSYSPIMRQYPKDIEYTNADPDVKEKVCNIILAISDAEAMRHFLDSRFRSDKVFEERVFSDEEAYNKLAEERAKKAHEEELRRIHEEEMNRIDNLIKEDEAALYPEISHEEEKTNIVNEAAEEMSNEDIARTFGIPEDEVAIMTEDDKRNLIADGLNNDIEKEAKDIEEASNPDVKKDDTLYDNFVSTKTLQLRKERYEAELEGVRTNMNAIKLDINNTKKEYCDYMDNLRFDTNGEIYYDTAYRLAVNDSVSSKDMPEHINPNKSFNCNEFSNEYRKFKEKTNDLNIELERLGELESTLVQKIYGIDMQMARQEAKVAMKNLAKEHFSVRHFLVNSLKTIATGVKKAFESINNIGTLLKNRNVQTNMMINKLHDASRRTDIVKYKAAMKLAKANVQFLDETTKDIEDIFVFTRRDYNHLKEKNDKYNSKFNFYKGKDAYLAAKAKLKYELYHEKMMGLQYNTKMEINFQLKRAGEALEAYKTNEKQMNLTKMKCHRIIYDFITSDKFYGVLERWTSMNTNGVLSFQSLSNCSTKDIFAFGKYMAQEVDPSYAMVSDAEQFLLFGDGRHNDEPLTDIPASRKSLGYLIAMVNLGLVDENTTKYIIENVITTNKDPMQAFKDGHSNPKAVAFARIAEDLVMENRKDISNYAKLEREAEISNIKLDEKALATVKELAISKFFVERRKSSLKDIKKQINKEERNITKEEKTNSSKDER